MRCPARDAHRTRAFISSPRLGPAPAFSKPNALTPKQIPCLTVP